MTQSRQGSYWNLVIPYALASGLFAPASPEARGALRYLLLHGSRILGIVRAGAFSLYGRSRRFPTGGTDQVYGVNQSRFMADMDEPDQLVLSLYGHLGAGMAPGTYVSGEGATVQPLRNAFHRTMYLPPNGASNAAFLETLRLVLLHEQRDRRGAPVSLRLANATPRPWLRPGRRISVRRLPTTFGPVSYTLESRERSVVAVVDLPGRRRPARTSLRVRLPRGARVTAVTIGGRPASFDRATETVDLSGRTGRVEVAIAYEGGSS